MYVPLKKVRLEVHSCEYLFAVSSDSPYICVKVINVYFMEIFGYTIIYYKWNSGFAHALVHSQ